MKDGRAGKKRCCRRQYAADDSDIDDVKEGLEYFHFKSCGIYLNLKNGPAISHIALFHILRYWWYGSGIYNPLPFPFFVPKADTIPSLLPRHSGIWGLYINNKQVRRGTQMHCHHARKSQGDTPHNRFPLLTSFVIIVPHEAVTGPDYFLFLGHT